MFGNDEKQDNVTKPVNDPGYLGSLENPAASSDQPVPGDIMGVPATPTSPADPVSGTNTAQPAATAPGVDLVSIKQQALQQLTPLVGHLDQTPEEKFRTTMMMIQATDDQTLLPKAFEAANQIADEKAKAQALLDVVNEINYFTQQK